MDAVVLPQALSKHDLAYRGKAPVNWCPNCQTVLANEQVVGRASAALRDRGRPGATWSSGSSASPNTPTSCMEHEGIDWPERIKIMQRNWVGKSEGTEISFGLDHPGVNEKEIRVFTTRPDTVYGVTFMVLAPEHPLVAKADHPRQKSRGRGLYRAKSRRQTEIERLSTEKEKDGVFTGAYVTNRLNGEEGAHLDRRLRAAELRHRRGDGRARPRRARLRLRQEIRTSHTGGHRPAGLGRRGT